MKKLILALAPDNYSKDTHIALGTWCFVGKEHLPQWEDGEFSPDPFANEKDWLEAEARADKLIQDFAPALAAELNRVNNVKKSEEFWRVLMHHWLSAFFLNFVLREKIIDRCLEKYGQDELEVEVLDVEGDFHFDSSNQFVYDGVNDQKFNQWMFSEILKERKPDRWHLKWKKMKADEVIQPFAPVRHHWKFRVLLFLEEFLRFKRVYGVSLPRQLMLSTALYFRKAPNLSLNYSMPGFAPKKNDELNWQTLLLKTIPRSLLQLEKIDSKFLFFKKGVFVLCGTLLYSDERWKVKLANFVERGGFYMTAQHGCNYGVALVHASLKWVESWRTRFLSWGWTQVQDYQLDAVATVAPLLSNLNCKYADLRKNPDDRIIYVGRDPNPFVYNLYPCTQPNQLIEYRRKKVRFLKKLETAILRKVQYRPAPFNPVSLRDKDYMTSQMLELGICEGPLHEKLFRAKLVICDSPGTTYHICMAANIPVIGIWPSQQYLFVRQTRDLFENLKSCKILFEDPDQAAEQVNKVFSEIDTWWRSEEIQTARKNWNDRNAQHSPNWFSQWFKFLREPINFQL